MSDWGADDDPRWDIATTPAEFDVRIAAMTRRTTEEPTLRDWTTDRVKAHAHGASHFPSDLQKLWANSYHVDPGTAEVCRRILLELLIDPTTGCLLSDLPPESSRWAKGRVCKLDGTVLTHKELAWV